MDRSKLSAGFLLLQNLMEQEEELEDLAIELFLEMKSVQRRETSSLEACPKRVWVSPFLQSRKLHGAFYSTLPNLRNDRPRFYRFMRMKPETYDVLVELLQ